jgi:X-Pro dipeptidyl-peptidase
MRIRARALATGGAVALASLAVAGPGVARAQGPVITVQDGKTQPVFSYQDAIRERVWECPIFCV